MGTFDVGKDRVIGQHIDTVSHRHDTADLHSYDRHTRWARVCGCYISLIFRRLRLASESWTPACIRLLSLLGASLGVRVPARVITGVLHKYQSYAPGQHSPAMSNENDCGTIGVPMHYPSWGHDSLLPRSFIVQHWQPPTFQVAGGWFKNTLKQFHRFTQDLLCVCSAALASLGWFICIRQLHIWLKGELLHGNSVCGQLYNFLKEPDFVEGWHISSPCAWIQSNGDQHSPIQRATCLRWWTQLSLWRLVSFFHQMPFLIWFFSLEMEWDICGHAW